MPHDSHAPSPSLSQGGVREVWAIAWPTVLTMSSYTVMQFIDKVMVAQVGPLEVAAQGNAGIWAFVPISIAMGLLTVVNTWVSQNLGAGTPENGPRYAWAAIWLSIVYWLIVLVPFAWFLPDVLSLMHDPDTVSETSRLIELESEYGRILLGASVVLIIGRGMHHYFFGLHRPKVITVAALIGNIANVGANYVLIFGKLGFPEMGLAGAAVGTVFGTTIELLIPMSIFSGPTMRRELGTMRDWLPRWKPIRDLIRVGWPAGLQFGNEIICWAVFMVVLVGKFGENHMTAGWAALGYMHLSFMPTVGISVAVSSLVGRYIGAGQHDLAAARARTGVKLALGYMTFCALVFFVFRHQLIDVFVADKADIPPEQAAEIVRIGGYLMICAAFFQTVDALGIVYSGALRGAGDTIWPGVMTFIYSWVFIVGLGVLITVQFPNLESIGPWIAAAVYITLLGLTMWIRFERGAWRNLDLLGKDQASLVQPAQPGPPASGPDTSVRDFAESESEAVQT